MQSIHQPKLCAVQQLYLFASEEENGEAEEIQAGIYLDQVF